MDFELMKCRDNGRNAGSPLCINCHPKQQQHCLENKAILAKKAILYDGRSNSEQNDLDNQNIIDAKYAAILASREISE